MANEIMPVEELIRETIPDPDYADGDNPGWFSGKWNGDTSELTVRYEADADAAARYRTTERTFRLLPDETSAPARAVKLSGASGGPIIGKAS